MKDPRCFPSQSEQQIPDMIVCVKAPHSWCLQAIPQTDSRYDSMRQGPTPLVSTHDPQFVQFVFCTSGWTALQLPILFSRDLHDASQVLCPLILSMLLAVSVQRLCHS